MTEFKDARKYTSITDPMVIHRTLDRLSEGNTLVSVSINFWDTRRPLTMTLMGRLQQSARGEYQIKGETWDSRSQFGLQHVQSITYYTDFKRFAISLRPILPKAPSKEPQQVNVTKAW